MQNAKDTFYIALRNRLNLLNPLRTIVIRAVQRPGIIVEDAEAPEAELMNDVFTLRWTSLAILEDVSACMSSIGCEIEYATSGTQAASSLDRGRAIAEMDRELLMILEPKRAQKVNYTSMPASVLQTQVFWSEPQFGKLTICRNQLRRLTTTQVFSFQEAGESS